MPVNKEESGEWRTLASSSGVPREAGIHSDGNGGQDPSM